MPYTGGNREDTRGTNSGVTFKLRPEGADYMKGGGHSDRWSRTACAKALGWGKGCQEGQRKGPGAVLEQEESLRRGRRQQPDPAGLMALVSRTEFI